MYLKKKNSFAGNTVFLLSDIINSSASNISSSISANAYEVDSVFDQISQIISRKPTRLMCPEHMFMKQQWESFDIRKEKLNIFKTHK